MIPTERALVCAHPTLVELPLLNLRTRDIACTSCRWRASLPVYTFVRDDEAYFATCIGFTFGGYWRDHLYASRQRAQQHRGNEYLILEVPW